MTNGGRIRMWIYALALFALTLSMHESGVPITAAAALILLTTVAITISLIRPGSLGTPDGRRLVPVRVRSARGTQSRQCDPDAAGRTRPRAPGGGCASS